MVIALVAGLLLAQSEKLPASLQEEEKSNEFAINVNLWPLLESHTLPDGNRRTSLWPLFHVTTMPKGGVHSWHVLNFLWGRNYHMLLPLYYSVDEHLGILPPLVLTGPDYFLAPPLVSGQWRHADGDLTTWVTPLFHLTNTPEGGVRSLHAGPYFQGQDYWAVPPLLTGAWTDAEGDRTTWVTPLFHQTTTREGTLRNLHVGPYFQGEDYWFVLPFAGSGTHEDGGRTTWITPLFHVTHDKAGNVETYHVGPYFEGQNGWSVPPLLMRGWNTADGFEMTMGLLFWLRTDKEGLASQSLCPVYWWERGRSWFVLPLLSGQWGGADSGRQTWLTPLFHVNTDKQGDVESFHVGPYFEGKDYWAVPPLLSWHVRDDDGASTWLTPFFHWTVDSSGLLRDMHLGPFMKGRDFWGIPPLLTGGWDHAGGGGTTWITPLFHVTTDAAGDVDSLHVGPYFQGKHYWAVPPLLSWHVAHADRSETTWLTPAFHLSADPEGRWSSAHLFPAVFYERDAYWAAPPLLSASWIDPDGSRTLWVTPMFHATEAPDGALGSLHVAPAWFWERDRYWAIPPLLTGGGTHADGAQTTWITPLFHVTEDKAGGLESLHALPAFFWKRDEYWLVPSLLSGGFTRPDGSTRSWITPLYHEDYAADGSLRSRHALNYFEGPKHHHVVPVFWDWTRDDAVRHTMFAPPVFVRTEEPDGGVTASLPWPIVTWRTGRELDTSLGMELRPFVVQQAGEQYEFNFLWRMFSVLSEEESTRVMVGPLWFSERPNKPDAMTKFQILGGLFARDCNYETERYRYRLLWFIPLSASDMRD